MSTGRDHLMANLALTAGCALGLKGNVGAEHYSAVMAGLLLGSIWITPDLDMYGTRTVVLRAWGPLWILWFPVLRYSKHRGRSHTYLRGPLFRLAWMLLIVLVALMVSAPWMAVTTQDHIILAVMQGWPWALPGYFVTQWLHLWMDKIPMRLERL